MMDRRSASRCCWPGRSTLSQICAEFLQVNILIEAQIQLQAAEDEKKKATRKGSWGCFLFTTQMSHPMTFWGPVSLGGFGATRALGTTRVLVHHQHTPKFTLPGREGEPWWHSQGWRASRGTELNGNSSILKWKSCAIKGHVLEVYPLT